MERFSLSDLQAQAILEMQLRRLQGLEKEKSMRNMQSCKEDCILQDHSGG